MKLIMKKKMIEKKSNKKTKCASIRVYNR